MLCLSEHLMKLKGPPRCLQAEITTNRTITYELWTLFVHVFLLGEAQVETWADLRILFTNRNIVSMDFIILIIFPLAAS